MTDATENTAVRFTGAQTIAVVEEAHRRLVDALTRPLVDIDCHEVEDCDLAFVQVLLAAQQTCRATGRGFQLLGSPALANACAAAGMDIALLSAIKGD